MATISASGSAVPSGYYLNPASWRIEPVASDGGRLPSGRGGWMRLPTPAALLLAPLLGATFVIFLPLVGFLVGLRALAAPVLRAFREPAADLASTLSGGWRPGEAHFTGKRPERAGTEERADRSDGLEALAAEIARMRRARTNER